MLLYRNILFTNFLIGVCIEVFDTLVQWPCKLCRRVAVGLTSFGFEFISVNFCVEFLSKYINWLKHSANKNLNLALEKVR